MQQMVVSHMASKRFKAQNRKQRKGRKEEKKEKRKEKEKIRKGKKEDKKGQICNIFYYLSLTKQAIAVSSRTSIPHGI